MVQKNSKRQFKTGILFFALLSWVHFSIAQNIDQNQKIRYISGGATLTNNGISLIPSFSLGKPAAIFDLSVGGEKLSFDPQFRFDIENARPWAIILWWRYKLANSKKFRMHVGAHPAWMFHAANFEDYGVTEEGWEARRFVAAEVSPAIHLTPHISLKPYYLIGHGFDRGLKNTHYITMRASISDIGITEQVRFSVTPEVYFLKMDADHGFYFASVFSLAHNQFPVSLSGMINKKIKSEIASKNFLWNVSITYSFGDKYVAVDRPTD